MRNIIIALMVSIVSTVCNGQVFPPSPLNIVLSQDFITANKKQVQISWDYNHLDTVYVWSLYRNIHNTYTLEATFSSGVYSTTVDLWNGKDMFLLIANSNICNPCYSNRLWIK